MLIFSVIFISLALVFYSIGVWSEKIQGMLKSWHLLFFWLGFSCDTTGTTIMSIMSTTFSINIHAVTGVIAIILMAVHAIWASIVLIKKNEEAAKKFHRFSIFVWILWLIPFFTGMIMNI